MSGARFPSGKADWLGVDEALDRILRRATPLPPRELPLAEALGHILAVDVTARVTLPPWDNAGMDGYAVRSRDLPDPFPEAGLPLPVAGEVLAGSPRPPEPPEGSAVRIMTGAPVPEGMDTVVRVEDTDREEGEPGVIRILGDRDRRGNVRGAGEDMTAGDRLLAAGVRVTAGRVAVLASAGLDPVPVVPRPRVALVPTGDELRPPSDFRDVLEGVAIPESNGPALAAACRAVGAIPHLLPPVPDDPASLRAALQEAASGTDLVVTLGGASMGTHDLVKDVLAEMGYRLDFWRVKMRPGSPLSFGWLPRQDAAPVPVVGLPGNPASSFVTFQLLVRPLVLRLAGETEIHRPVVEATAGSPMASHPSRTLFLRVALEVDDAGGLVALPTGPQGSGLVRSLGDAQGLAVVPAGPPCPAGTPLRVLLLDDGPAGVEEPGYMDTLRGAGGA